MFDKTSFLAGLCVGVTSMLIVYGGIKALDHYIEIRIDAATTSRITYETE